jgi:hypothetical protein
VDASRLGARRRTSMFTSNEDKTLKKLVLCFKEGVPCQNWLSKFSECQELSEKILNGSMPFPATVVPTNLGPSSSKAKTTSVKLSSARNNLPPLAAAESVPELSSESDIAVIGQFIVGLDHHPVDFRTFELLMSKISPMIVKSNTLLRAACFRAIENVLGPSGSDLLIQQLIILQNNKFWTVLCRSLEAHAARDQERKYAFRLLRRCLSCCASGIPSCVVRSLSAIAVVPEDECSTCSSLFLNHLAVFNPRVLQHANGFRGLWSMSNSKASISIFESRVTSLMILHSDLNLRAYLPKDVGLSHVLSPILDIYVKDHELCLGQSLCALRFMLNSWAGIFNLMEAPEPSADSVPGLKAVVDILALPFEMPQSLHHRKWSILSVLFESLHLVAPSPRESLEIVASCFSKTGSDGPMVKYFDKQFGDHRPLLSQMLATILAALHSCEIVEILVNIAKQFSSDKDYSMDMSDKAVSRNHVSALATIFLAEVSRLSFDYLPNTIYNTEGGSQLQLSVLFSQASSFKQRQVSSVSSRNKAANLFAALHKFSLVRTSFENSLRLKAEASMFHEVTNIQIAAIDDTEFSTILREGQSALAALSSSSSRGLSLFGPSTPVEAETYRISDPIMAKNLEVLGNVLQMIGRGWIDHLFEAIKKGFIKGTLQYMCSTAFLLLERVPICTSLSNSLLILLHSMLECEEPVCLDAIMESKMLDSIAAIFIHETSTDPSIIATKDVTSLITPVRVSKTMSRTIFSIIGVFTSHHTGIAMLENKRIFQFLAHFFVGSVPRIDVARIILESLDIAFTSQSPANTTFELAIANEQVKSVRMLAYNRLVEVSRHASLQDWTAELLVTQLSSGDVDFAQLVGKQIGIFLLKEENAEKLVIFISQIIDFVRKSLGPRSLLYKFLSLPDGIKAMADYNWLQPELEYWITEGWLAYAKEIEQYHMKYENSRLKELKNALLKHVDEQEQARAVDLHSPTDPECFRIPKPSQTMDGEKVDFSIPLHFLGELCHSQEGACVTATVWSCSILHCIDNFAGVLLAKSTGHFKIVNAALQTKNDAHVCGALWTVANLCQSQLGSEIVQEFEWVQRVMDIAQTHHNYLVRGMALSALGLCSVSSFVRFVFFHYFLKMKLISTSVMLSEAGWSCTSKFTTIPWDLNALFKIVHSQRSSVESSTSLVIYPYTYCHQMSISHYSAFSQYTLQDPSASTDPDVEAIIEAVRPAYFLFSCPFVDRQHHRIFLDWHALCSSTDQLQKRKRSSALG